jgi:hypothetical protein
MDANVLRFLSFLFERPRNLIGERLDQICQCSSIACLNKRFNRHARNGHECTKPAPLGVRHLYPGAVVALAGTLVRRQVCGDLRDVPVKFRRGALAKRRKPQGDFLTNSNLIDILWSDFDFRGKTVIIGTICRIGSPGVMTAPAA